MIVVEETRGRRRRTAKPKIVVEAIPIDIAPVEELMEGPLASYLGLLVP
jgi:hypothetical protein